MKKYLICHTIRSGSKFLAYLLKDNNIGFPLEWLHPEQIVPLPKDIIGLEITASKFSISKIQNVLGDSFVWFYLSRNNIVAQGISFFLAHKSGHFQSGQKPIIIPYDRKEIKEWIRLTLYHEYLFEKIFIKYNVLPIRLKYENIIYNKEKTIELFRKMLDIPHEKFRYTNTLEKQGNDLNKEYEDRFRDEEKHTLFKWRATYRDEEKKDILFDVR